MKSFNGGFKNFWEYNKGKIIALIFLAAFVVLLLTQCNMNPEKYFSILYVTDSYSTDGEMLKQQLKQNVDFSKTDEGEMEVYFEHIQVSDSKADRIGMATGEELTTRMINGDCSLLLFDKETVLYFIEEDGVYIDLSQYAKKHNIPEENLIKSKDGKSVYAISVTDNKFLTKCSLDCSDLYVAIRVPQDGDVDKYTNAKASLEYIISNQ
ncbi:MAG: hypothetical protein IJB70_02830 [Clostridia bacterium]|nr:hypothetical protein [Clostridia bacterium]